KRRCGIRCGIFFSAHRVCYWPYSSERALGNVVRGVPLDASGYFFEALWTNFRLGDETGILDWYTILVGVLSLAALVMHGGLWVQMKTSGAVSERAGKLAGRAWWAVLVLTAGVTAVT